MTPVLVVADHRRVWMARPFFLLRMLGLAWAAVWYWYYRDTPAEHPSVNDAERELIHVSHRRRARGPVALGALGARFSPAARSGSFR